MWVWSREPRRFNSIVCSSFFRQDKHKIRQNLLDIDIKPSGVDLEAVVIFVKSVVVVVVAAAVWPKVRWCDDVSVYNVCVCRIIINTS